MSSRFFIAVGILLCASSGIVTLWRQPFILSLLLIALTLLKRRLFPIKREFLWYMGLTLGGAIVEVVMVNIGGGWRYAKPQFLNIPLWMPLFWGLVGTTVIVLYRELIGKHSSDF
jgi:hypothetical protein